MTRTTLFGLVAAAALGGCVPANLLTPSAGPEKEARPVEPPRPTLKPPVTAGQITPTNAHEKADALRDEMDRDYERALDAADAKPEKK